MGLGTRAGRAWWLLLAVAFMACARGGTDAPEGGAAGSGGTGGTAVTTIAVGQGGGGAPCDPGDPAVDDDLDGFSENEGDCNDCDANANPNAVEVVGNPSEAADEDCDGEVDEAPVVCDAGLVLDSPDPMDAARAVDLCQLAGEGSDWGVVSAEYVRADGTPWVAGLNTGILQQFGDNVVPQGNHAMLVLSTGYARDLSHPDHCPDHGCSTTYDGTAPPGFPQPAGLCALSDEIGDDIGLELQLRAPSNARGYSFRFAFFSHEFPRWVCTVFNDQFVSLVEPAPMGAMNGNISFDAAGNPVSVNLAHFAHCDPSTYVDFADVCESMSAQCPPQPNPYCLNGPWILAGTGYDPSLTNGSGATGWLATTAPVDPGEALRIRWAIWDAHDLTRDSAVIIDDFRWMAESASVFTGPVDNPK